MNSDRLAHEIHLVYASDEDGPEPGLYIDGTRFPYFIGREVPIDAGNNAFPNVEVTLFGANIKVTDDHGLIKHQATATPEQESALAKRRAKEIVWEGLGDVIEWLARANYEREKKEAEAERDEAVWATQAYLNLAAILDGRGFEEGRSTIEAFLAQAPDLIRETAVSVRAEAGR